MIIAKYCSRAQIKTNGVGGCMLHILREERWENLRVRDHLGYLVIDGW